MCPFFISQSKVIFMNKRTKYLTHASVIGALYVVLTYLQNLIFPDSASMAIQFRASEALCVLALFTPAAIPGLAVGCLLFNLSFSGALPLDFLVGTGATVLATGSMWLLRRVKIRSFPLPALLMPALFNGFLVGWELQLYIGGGFWYNLICVVIGEAAVLLLAGSSLYYMIKKIGPHRLGIR
jgi:uncharacterized membrane protein